MPEPAPPALLSANLAEGLGHFIVAYSTVETILEIGIAKLLSVDPIRGSIVTGGLAFKARASILSSLLHLDEAANATAIDALKKIMRRGDRNDIVHAVIAYRPDRMKFYRRMVDERFKVRERNYDAKQIYELAVEFGTLGATLQEQLRISERDIADFFNAAHKTSHK